MITILYTSHVIEIDPCAGTITYDGTSIKAQSIGIQMYAFTLLENGCEVRYEVAFDLDWVVMKRDGMFVRISKPK